MVAPESAFEKIAQIRLFVPDHKSALGCHQVVQVTSTFLFGKLINGLF